MDIQETSCCGLLEINGLSYSSRDNIRDFLDCLNNNVYSGRDEEECLFDHIRSLNKAHSYKSPPYLEFFIFTDNVKRGRGRRLYNYIKKHDLGYVTQSKSGVNPNSRNVIRIWIWKPNVENLEKWSMKYHKDILQNE